MNTPELATVVPTPTLSRSPPLPAAGAVVGLAAAAGGWLVGAAAVVGAGGAAVAAGAGWLGALAQPAASSPAPAPADQITNWRRETAGMLQSPHHPAPSL